MKPLKKKVISMILSAAITLPVVCNGSFGSPGIVYAEPASYTLTDTLEILKAALGITEADTEFDIDHDGTVTLGDALLCLKYALGIAEAPDKDENTVAPVYTTQPPSYIPETSKEPADDETSVPGETPQITDNPAVKGTETPAITETPDNKEPEKETPTPSQSSSPSESESPEETKIPETGISPSGIPEAFPEEPEITVDTDEIVFIKDYRTYPETAVEEVTQASFTITVKGNKSGYYEEGGINGWRVRTSDISGIGSKIDYTVEDENGNLVSGSLASFYKLRSEVESFNDNGDYTETWTINYEDLWDELKNQPQDIHLNAGCGTITLSQTIKVEYLDRTNGKYEWLSEEKNVSTSISIKVYTYEEETSKDRYQIFEEPYISVDLEKYAGYTSVGIDEDTAFVSGNSVIFEYGGQAVFRYYDNEYRKKDLIVNVNETYCDPIGTYDEEKSKALREYLLENKIVRSSKEFDLEVGLVASEIQLENQEKVMESFYNGEISQREMKLSLLYTNYDEKLLGYTKAADEILWEKGYFMTELSWYEENHKTQSNSAKYSGWSCAKKYDLSTIYYDYEIQQWQGYDTYASDFEYLMEGNASIEEMATKIVSRFSLGSSTNAGNITFIKVHYDEKYNRTYILFIP